VSCLSGRLVYQEAYHPSCLLLAIKLLFQSIRRLQFRSKFKSQSQRTGEILSQRKNFYLDYRTRVAYAYAASGKYKPFSSIADWKSKEGTKLSLLVKILEHHLSHDERPPATFDKDGRVCFPDESDTNPSLSSHTSKILVFQEFPMMSEMIISVLLASHIQSLTDITPLQVLYIHNIQCLALNGSMTLHERDEVIVKFKTDPKYRVLLVSMVGGVGLNLTVARYIIVFVSKFLLLGMHGVTKTFRQDMVWSKIALDQIIGRAHRFGQEKEVIVYLMVALGTVDTLMIDHGFAKGSLLETFLSPHSQGVFYHSTPTHELHLESFILSEANTPG
jgi:SNF2 family DNA or RNA helicase